MRSQPQLRNDKYIDDAIHQLDKLNSFPANAFELHSTPSARRSSLLELFTVLLLILMVKVMSKEGSSSRALDQDHNTGSERDLFDATKTRRISIH